MRKGLKIYINADMEGIAGNVFLEDVKSRTIDNYYHRQRMRQLMTDEVKAAIKGAMEAGAEVIYVCDNHSIGYNLLFEQFHPPVEIIHGRGERRPTYLPCFDETFDAVVGVGCGYAPGGTKGAVVAEGVWEINDGQYLFTTGGQLAATAGYYGVPLVFISGDDVGCTLIKKELIPDIEIGIVKYGLGYYNARSLTPKAAQEIIREGVKKGIERRKEIKPFRIEGPIKVVVGMNRYKLRRDKAHTVTGKDWMEALHKAHNKLWADFGNEMIDYYTFPDGMKYKSAVYHKSEIE